jgi:DNA-binding protein HU-beta
MGTNLLGSKGDPGMTKPEMIAHVAKHAQISKKDAATVIETLVKCIHSSLKAEKGRIRIASLGTFRVLRLGARKGVNPRTGQEMTIPAMSVPRFSPAKALREAVQGEKIVVA